jgi:NAD kinase
LIKKSNKLSPHNSKVLYFFLNDAYSTYQARRFDDWTEFSITDGRNLVRLNKGDRIKIVKSKHQNRIFEVELLDGFEKNRKYFVIKEDLISDYILVEASNES